MVCETDPNKCSVFNMGGKIVLLIFSRKFTIAISAMTDRNCHEDKVHNRPTVAVELEIFSLWSNGAMCVAVGRVWNFLVGFCFHSKCREGDRRFFFTNGCRNDRKNVGMFFGRTFVIHPRGSISSLVR